MDNPARVDTPSLYLHDVPLTLDSRPFSLEVKPGEYLFVYGDEPPILDALTDVISGHGAALSGEIGIAGAVCTQHPPAQRAIGALDAREPLFHHLSVWDNIAFPLHARGEKGEAVAAQLRRVTALLGLDPIMANPTHTLTDEMQFRVKLGRLLTYAPQVYVLNQPFEHMSDRITARCGKLLMTLHRALNLTMLHLTAHRHELFAGSGRVAVLQRGSCAQCADIATLVARPTNAYVARVIGQANVLTGYTMRIDDGLAEIRLANGSLMPAIAADDLDVGKLCSLCIRPEHIAISLSPLSVDDDADTALTATVQEIRHLGDSVHLRCKLADGTEMDIRRSAMQYSGTLQIGQTIYLAWSANHAHALRDEDP